MRGALPVVAIAALAASAALAFAFARIPAAARPRASGGDFLEVAFGGAREAFSSAMVKKADVYFHGGVEAEERHEHGGRGDGCACEDCRGHHRHGEHAGAEAAHDEAEHAAAERRAMGFWSGPYRWIDSRIHTQEHRHLEGTDSIEMIPLLWAAVRADRSNVSAWSEAAYVAAGMMKDYDLALRILAEGIAANPGAAELVCDRGHVYCHRLHDEASAEKEFRRVVEMTEGAVNEKDVRVRIDSMAYLANFAEKRGDADAVRRYAEEALRLAPDYAGTRGLVEMAGKAKKEEAK